MNSFYSFSKALSAKYEGFFLEEEQFPSMSLALIASAIIAMVLWLVDRQLGISKALEQVLGQKIASSTTRKIPHRYHLLGKNGPPCVPQELPFFGSALAFRKDPIGFVRIYNEMFSKDGMFAFRIRSTKVVVVTDPDAAAFVTSGRIPQLTFQFSKYIMMRNSMRMSDEGAKFISHQTKTHVIIHRHLLEKRDLSHMMYDWQRYFNDIYVPAALSRCRQEQKRVSIYDFFGECIFCATAHLFFGDSSIATREQFENALMFDRGFSRFSRIFSGWYQRFLYPKETKAREDFVDTFRPLFNEKGSNTSNNSDICQMFKELEALFPGISSDDRIRYFGLLMFASILNTVPTAFWFVYYLLASDGALEAVRDEVNEVLRERDLDRNEEESDSRRSSGSSPIFTLEEMEKMKCIDSIITETLRLKSTAVAFRFRRALKDCNINLKVQGKPYKFRVNKNDLFLTCPTLIHLDPNVYPNPTTFQWDRFLNNPEGVLPLYRKDNSEIRVRTPLDAFGGGPSICPGRRFARCEIKAAVATMVLQYDMSFSEVANEQSVPPPPSIIANQGSILMNGTPSTDVFIKLSPCSTT